MQYIQENLFELKIGKYKSFLLGINRKYHRRFSQILLRAFLIVLYARCPEFIALFTFQNKI